MTNDPVHNHPDMQWDMAWQKIDTAPKEHGKEFLACEPGRTMAVVEYLDARNVMEGRGFISGYYISDGHNDPIWYRNWVYCTHWMPLPPPPNSKE